MVWIEWAWLVAGSPVQVPAVTPWASTEIFSSPWDCRTLE
jgi:hypothetical protein